MVCNLALGQRLCTGKAVSQKKNLPFPIFQCMKQVMVQQLLTVRKLYLLQHIILAADYIDQRNGVTITVVINWLREGDFLFQLSF